MNTVQILNVIYVDQILENGVSHIQHSHERLTAGDQPSILERRK
jgi:hypothetical protein